MIGYYVHHHGRGHRQRMESIAAELSTPLTVLSSLTPEPSGPWTRWVTLPLDADERSVPADVTAGGTLHWAPLHHPGLRGRMAAIASWIGTAAPDLVVVDVSVEVAVLCRLTGTPVVVMGMPGDRSDPPHRLGYDAATAILAPWAAEFADPAWPAAWRAKTRHVGGISRFDGRRPPVRTAPTGPLRVAVLWGGGGRARPPQVDGLDVRSAVGGHDAQGVWDLLAWCDVAVAHAGQNVVAELAATRTPAVVIADERPHAEQLATVARLRSADIAVALDEPPAGTDWPDLLERAVARGGAGWARWSPGHGARDAAGFLDRLAGRTAPDHQLELGA